MYNGEEPQLLVEGFGKEGAVPSRDGSCRRILRSSFFLRESDSRARQRRPTASYVCVSSNLAIQCRGEGCFACAVAHSA